MKKKKILVVEDMTDIREIIVAFIKWDNDDNFEVLEAVNGKDVFKKITVHDFDLIVSDFSMPVMNGGEMARKLRRMGIEIPVIMMTGYHMSNAVSLLNDNIVQKVLQKPLKREVLLGAIKKLLD